MLRRLLPYLLYFVYKLLQWSWRIEVRRTPQVQKWVDENQNFIVAHWHGDEMGILHLLREYHVSCIISTSKDGDLMNRAVQLLGAETVRGSSTRGGTGALKGIIRTVRKGRRPSVAVDGPKGPIYKVKPGIFQISRLTQLPIAPISFHASRQKIFEKSWNKGRLPLPFSKVTIQWGEAMPPIQKEEDSKDPKFSEKLEKLLNAAKEAASHSVS